MENIYKNLLFLSITTPLSLLNLKWKYWFTFCVCKWKQWQTLLSRSPKITADCGCSHEIKRCSLLRKNTVTNSELKSRDITLPAKVHIVKTMVFPVVMDGFERLDHQEDWTMKNRCFQTVVLENSYESPLDIKETKPVNPKWNQPWIFVGRNDGKAEAPIVWLPDVKSWLIGKDADAGKDWGKEEKGLTENEMIGWPLLLNGYEFEQTLRDSEGQESLSFMGWQRVGHNWVTKQLRNNYQKCLFYVWLEHTLLVKINFLY